MAQPGVIDYSPPPTIKAFIKDHRPAELFYSWIVGPVGSGKTTGIFFKLIYMAKLQAPSPDGIRRTRAVVVRNTMPQLKDTTLVSWGYWFKDGQAGHWNATDKIFTLRFADVECEVMFRPLDTPDDVARVLSLEINFAIIDEFVEIPKAIIDALSARLGRYKQPDGTPVTIWGMWGSSNPSTEDNWWFDYLHGDACRRYIKDKAARARYERSLLENGDDPNATYFHQPSALTEDAENIDNLPGGAKYYTNQMKGKSDTWIKQFIEAEWGFSISGQPVVSGFKSDIHVSKWPLTYNPHLPLVVGFDPGLGGSAFIFGQEDYDGRVSVFKELVQAGVGATRLINERLRPVLRNDFPKADRVILAVDPAAANRSSNDEKTIVKTFKDAGFTVDVESNNRFPLRLDAINFYTGQLVEGSPALLIDPSCKILIRALKGGWRWAIDTKKDIIKGAQAEDNQYTHPGDAFGYLLRYFHRSRQKEEKYGKRLIGGRVIMPKSTAAKYHFS